MYGMKVWVHEHACFTVYTISVPLDTKISWNDVTVHGININTAAAAKQYFSPWWDVLSKTS